MTTLTPRLSWPPTTPDALATVPAWWLALPVVLMLCALASTTFLLIRRHRPHTTETTAPARDEGRSWRHAEATVTLSAAAMATAGAWNGMQHVFQRRLHLPETEAWILGGFLELAMVASGIRARHNVKEHGVAGADGTAVWVIAALSAGLSASAETDTVGRAVRLVMPMVGAWMWERFLAGYRAEATRTAQGIAWRWTPRRLAVALGLADPAARVHTDIDRSRRLARLTRARVRVDALDRSRLPWLLAALTARPLRRVLAEWWLQRLAYAAVEHLHLGQDPAAAAAIRATVAAVAQLRAATAPDALTDHTAWSLVSTQSTRLDPVESIEPGRAPRTPALTGSSTPVASTPLDPVDPGSSTPARLDRAPIDLDSSTQTTSTPRSQTSPQTSGHLDPVDPSGEGARVTSIEDRRHSKTLDPRPEDVTRIHELLHSGEFTRDQLKYEPVRLRLGISYPYARAAVQQVQKDIDNPAYKEAQESTGQAQ